MPTPGKDSWWETHFLCVQLLEGETCQFLDKSLSDGISNLAVSLEAIHTGHLQSAHFAL